MISVDAYPFLAFSDLICHLDKTCTPPSPNPGGGWGVKISEKSLLGGGVRNFYFGGGGGILLGCHIILK